MSGFKKFVSYYKPHMGLFIFDTFCSLLIGIINLAYPYATRAIINEFIPEKNLEMIQKRLRTIITGLANCGLDSAQTANDDLRTIIDNFLNGGMRTDFGTVISQ